MAQTEFTTNNALTKKLWDEKLFRDIEIASYFNKFTGTSAESLVHKKTQLEKSQGDKITFGLRMRLSGAGKTGDDVLEGNEESLSTYDSSVLLEQYRHAVRTGGQLTEQRAMFSIDQESRDAIKTWGAEKFDALHFDAVFASPTLIAYRNTSTGAFTTTGTASTAKSALRAADSKITPQFISALKTIALTGKDRTIVPLRPVRVDGGEYFVLLVHPYALYDLKTNTDFMQARREALERGKDNPLFKNAVAIWDNVVIHEHELCPKALDGGAGSEPWSKGVFMGAQALVRGDGKKMETKQKTFDYDNQTGYSIAFQTAIAKPVFNGTDFGSIGVYLANSNLSA